MTSVFSLLFAPWLEDLLLVSLSSALLGIIIPRVIFMLAWQLVHESCLESGSVWLTK